MAPLICAYDTLAGLRGQCAVRGVLVCSASTTLPRLFNAAEILTAFQLEKDCWECCVASGETSKRRVVEVFIRPRNIATMML